MGYHKLHKSSSNARLDALLTAYGYLETLTLSCWYKHVSRPVMFSLLLVVDDFGMASIPTEKNISVWPWI